MYKRLNMRKIILTQKQLSEALGEDYEFLNDDNGNANEYDGNVNTVTSDKFSNGKTPDPLLGDKFAKELAPRNFFSTFGGRAVGAASIMYESNSDLKNTPFIIPKKLREKMMVSLNNIDKSNPAYETLSFILNSKHLDESYLTTFISDYERDNKTNQFKYNSMNGSEFYEWAKFELDKERKRVLDNKKRKKENGEENAFIKPHQKIGYGTAHTKK